ncbi:MAG: hypothetical protein SVS15_09780 [Thermodesulfobacteriota bacterium]|nr:hypothetical protein [Thermodesulfobacteriota bacterium]
MDGKGYTTTAARLVWAYRVGPIHPGQYVLALDGNSANLRIENLEMSFFGSPKPRPSRRAEPWRLGRLSNASIRGLRNLYAARIFSLRELSREFETSFQNISLLVRGLSRRGAGGPITLDGIKRSGRRAA